MHNFRYSVNLNNRNKSQMQRPNSIVILVFWLNECPNEQTQNVIDIEIMECVRSIAHNVFGLSQKWCAYKRMCKYYSCNCRANEWKWSVMFICYCSKCFLCPIISWMEMRKYVIWPKHTAVYDFVYSELMYYWYQFHLFSFFNVCLQI